MSQSPVPVPQSPALLSAQTPSPAPQSDLLKSTSPESAEHQPVLTQPGLLVSALRAHGSALCVEVARKLGAGMGDLPFPLLLYSTVSWPAGDLCFVATLLHCVPVVQHGFKQASRMLAAFDSKPLSVYTLLVDAYCTKVDMELEVRFRLFSC